MDFNLTRVLEVNDLQGKDYMYLIWAGQAQNWMLFLGIVSVSFFN